MAERKVWMIIAHFYPVVGGAERQVQRVATHLQRDHGLAVTILTRRHSARLPATLPSHETLDGLRVIRLPSQSLLVSKTASLVFFLSAFWQLARYGRGDNYHAHDEGVSAWIAVIARHLFGGRAIIKLRSGAYFYSGFSGWRQRLFFRLLALADQVIVVNSEMMALLKAQGLTAEKIAYIPNGIDLDSYQPASGQSVSALRQSLSLPPDKTLALFVGRLDPLKGVDVLLDAWAALSDSVRQQCQLVIVGDGPDMAALKQRITQHSIGASVTMTGEQELVRDYYWAADFLILPSRTEGLSNTLLEAFACGLPAVASKVGGAIDLIREGENGLLFETENPTALAKAIEQMLVQRSKWPAMGDCARRTVLAQADLRPIAARVAALYV